MAKDLQRIVFIHPDLGIGGAERLVVDAAVGLQELGHKVTIFTNHCDPGHCFEEARNGTLDVRIRGNSIIPPSIFNRFSILCAILRQLHLVLQICVFSSELELLAPDTFFIDQLSACIPCLQILYPTIRVLFYCHFPDKLLARRRTALKKLYRIPFDWVESWTTGSSDVILVNSKFTRGIFAGAFPNLRHLSPSVVYPCVEAENGSSKSNGVAQDGATERRTLWKGKDVILSINRFERLKHVDLAIDAFARLDDDIRNRARLVVAGGYDHRVIENVGYHQELVKHAEGLGLRCATAKNLVTALSIPPDISVLFLLSVPGSLKATLLESARLLVYTPKFEHFGIVPLEAMLSRCPVLAATTGGPTETVVDGETGWLRDADKVGQWQQVMEMALNTANNNQLMIMGQKGRQRVLEKFSRKSMAKRLEEEIYNAKAKTSGKSRNTSLWLTMAAIGSILALGMAVFARYAVVF